VDVERRLRGGADVELGGGGCVGGTRTDPGQLRLAVRQRGPGSDLGLGGCDQAGPQRLGQLAIRPGEDGGEDRVERVEGVQGGAAVHARVGGLGAGADLDVGEDHAAGGERERGRVGVDHAAVEDDHAVGAAGVLAYPLAHLVGAGLLGTLDQDADVHRELALGGQLARRVQQRKEVALVVGRAAGVEAAVADRRLERRRVPQLRVARVLDVVVPVDHHRRRVLLGRAQLAHDQRRAAGGGDHLGGAAGAADALDGPRGGVHERLLVACAGRDRRDREPVDGLVEQRVTHW
jgi:hypothetical protein